jgi:hypothetical protein
MPERDPDVPTDRDRDPEDRIDPDHEITDETRRPTWLAGVNSAEEADPDRRSGADVPDPPAYESEDDADDVPHLERGSPEENESNPYDPPPPEVP